MENFGAYLANSRKAILNIATVLLTVFTYIISTNQLPDKYAGMLTTAVGVIGFVVHYLTPNADALGTTVADDSAVDDAEDEDLPEFTDDELITKQHSAGELPTLSVAQALSEPEPTTGKHEAADATV